jgi:hypothetical protein
MAKSWRGSAEQVVDGRCGVPFLDRDETAALAGAVSVSPGPVLGECLGASGALQMVLAASVAAGGHSAAALLSGAQEAVRGLRFDSVAS